jgi:hypothetical protein
MAARLQTFPESSARRYPWETWLDGSVWQLFRGEDYQASSKTIVATARSRAKRMNGSVRTRLLGDEGREVGRPSVQDELRRSVLLLKHYVGRARPPPENAPGGEAGIPVGVSTA